MSTREEMEEEPQEVVVTVPLFLKKLWKIVNDKNAEDIIGWNASGDGFVIYDQVRFITELLPQYFKHNHLASFVRQLNFYDFHKVANCYKNEIEFAHPYFLKDLPETLAFITRKSTNTVKKSASDEKSVNELLDGVKELKTKHNLIDGDLKRLQRENAALWSEINSLTIKYTKQTRIINKLIHFLVSYIHSHQNEFGKQKVSVTRNRTPKVIKGSPELLQIDYRNARRRASEATVESLLEESAHDEDYDTYTVTYPGKKAKTSNQYPIEEISTEIDPYLEESSSYIVKFPKKKSRVNSGSKEENSTKEKKPDKNLENVEISTEKSITKIEKCLGLEPESSQEVVAAESPLIQLNLPAETANDEQIYNEIPSVEIYESDPNPAPKTPESNKKSQDGPLDVLLTPEFDPTLTQVTQRESNSPTISPIPPASPKKSPLEEIKSLPLASRSVPKWNILDNPKQSLGVYLENVQLELDDLQQILNEFNGKDVLDCFTTDDNVYPNLHSITKELEDELSKIPEQSNKETDENKAVMVPEQKFDAQTFLDEYLDQNKMF